MHQLSSAVGRVELKLYPKQMAEIDESMNYFWDLLEGVPGIRAHRTAKGSKTTMGGWYNLLGIYNTEELEGLSVSRFCEAVRDEGVECGPGCNKSLHLHPIFNNIDVYQDGKPSRIANSASDIRQPLGSLPVSEGIQERVFSVPWFKHYRPELIKEYADAYRKVSENYKELLDGDKGNPKELGGWGLTFRKK